MRICFFLLFLAAVPAWAGDGHLMIQRHPEMEARYGSAPAKLRVYDASGNRVVGSAADGSLIAGEAVSLPEGWYFVEVGSLRADANLKKVYVAEERTTVVPTGWVRVRTIPLEEQPTRGCAQWTAALHAFVQGSGTELAAIHSNVAEGPTTYGAVQLPAGPAVVYFNSIPTYLDVIEDQVVTLPTGFVVPTSAATAQLVAGDPLDVDASRVGLCLDGGQHVPARTYALGTRNEAGETDWTEVRVEVADPEGPDALETAELPSRRLTGERATPAALTAEDQAAIERIRASSSPLRNRVPRPAN